MYLAGMTTGKRTRSKPHDTAVEREDTGERRLEEVVVKNNRERQMVKERLGSGRIT